MTETRTLIIGVGNADRGDDGAGLAVASRLQERLYEQDRVQVIQHWGEATGLVQAMKGWDRVLIIDAANAGALPGDYHVLDVSEAALPYDLTETSSHGFGLAQAIELARALDALPSHCLVYAIEGEAFETGAPLSEDAERAVDAVTEEIMRMLEKVHA